MPTLTTDRLVLREFTTDDAPFVHLLMNSPGWLRYIGDRHIRTPADAQRYLENGPLVSYARDGFGLLLALTRHDLAPAGMCGLLRRGTLPDIELGFAFLAAHEGRGYATEASRAVLVDAQVRLGLRRVSAIVQPDNPGSLRVLAKLGFRLERDLQLSPDGPSLHLLARELPGPDATASATV